MSAARSTSSPKRVSAHPERSGRTAAAKSRGERGGRAAAAKSRGERGGRTAAAKSRGERGGRTAAAKSRGAKPTRELITVAIPKGRLLEEASTIFEKAVGVSPKELLSGTRKLAADAPEAGLRFISIRAADVASYVEHGAAEVGICGLDVLREEPRDLYEPLDLGIGRCSVIVARPTGAPPLGKGIAPRVATKYASLATQHYARKSLPAEIIPLHGSIEVAPSLGLADAIVDITETGETLRANGLTVEETVLEVSARLVVNRVALKLHPERLRTLIAALRDACDGGAAPDPVDR